MRVAIVVAVTAAMLGYASSAVAARPIRGGHYFFHQGSTFPGDVGTTVLFEVSKRGARRFVGSSYIEADGRCQDFKQYGYLTFETSPRGTISSAGHFSGPRSEELKYSGIFVTARLIRGTISGVSSDPRCQLPPMSFVARFSRHKWRRYAPLN